MNVNGTDYSSKANIHKKRERREESISQGPSLLKKPTVSDILLARPINIEEAVEAKPPTAKRDREWKQIDENSAANKKLQHDVAFIMDNLEPRRAKRGREEECSLNELEEDELPIIEEIPEPSSTSAKASQTALALIPCAPGELQRHRLRLACVHGDIEYIKQFIDMNPSVIIDLCQGMTFRNSRMNDLLVGLNLAVVNNRASVVDYLLSLPAVKQNVHSSKNLVLRVAFYYNRLFISSKLLQIPAVVNSLETPFIERYLVSTAESGNIFQFLLILSMPDAEKALHLIDCEPTYHSFLDVINSTAAKFAEFQSAWQGFLEADYTLVKENSQTFLVQRDELIDILKRSHFTTTNIDDLLKLANLSLN